MPQQQVTKRNPSTDRPRWMSRVLLAAAVYNIAFGAVTVLAPNLVFDLAGIARPTYPALWQCIGMIVGVYGVGYAAASLNPFRHWPIVLVGFLGKIFGPIGFVYALATGQLPLAFLAVIVLNDLIWWVPFALILRGAWRYHLSDAELLERGEPVLAEELDLHRDQRGRTLGELSDKAPRLVVFLRHAGCTFCREALAKLGAERERIEAGGTRIVLVHQGDEEDLRPLLRQHGLGDVGRIGDPSRRLYRAFGLRRGRLDQLFGPRVFVRGFQAGIVNKAGLGGLSGDGLQMPGVFLLRERDIVKGFRHRSAADDPDYRELAACPIR